MPRKRKKYWGKRKGGTSKSGLGFGWVGFALDQRNVTVVMVAG